MCAGLEVAATAIPLLSFVLVWLIRGETKMGKRVGFFMMMLAVVFTSCVLVEVSNIDPVFVTAGQQAVTLLAGQLSNYDADANDFAQRDGLCQHHWRCLGQAE